VLQLTTDHGSVFYRLFYSMRFRNSSAWCCVCSVCYSIWQSLKFQFKSVFGSGSKTAKESLVLMVVSFSIAFG